MKQMFVEVRYREGTVEDEFSVPLLDREPLEVDAKTEEAVSNWHDWVERGFQL